MGAADAIQKSLQSRNLTRSTHILTGIVTGMIADGVLQDIEVQMLTTWLAENPEVTTVWPGSAIARLLIEVLADGVITAEKRSHLLDTLQKLVGSDFANTGSVSTDVADLPFDDDVQIDFRDCGVCLTGEFLYGTRAACERITEKAGAYPYNIVSKKVSYLIVGTHVSPAWLNTSYGRKIMRAMELKQEGHGISIIREQRWMDALAPA